MRTLPTQTAEAQHGQRHERKEQVFPESERFVIPAHAVPPVCESNLFAVDKVIHGLRAISKTRARTGQFVVLQVQNLAVFDSRDVLPAGAGENFLFRRRPSP